MKPYANRKYKRFLLCLILVIAAGAISGPAMAEPDSETALTDELVERVATLNRSAVVTLTAAGADTEHELAAVLIDPKGIAVTVANGLSPSHKFSVRQQDGTTYRATLVALDHRAGVAVIKIESAERLPYAVLGDSTGLHKGDPLLVMDVPAGKDAPISRNAVETIELSQSGRRYIIMAAVSVPVRDGTPVFDPKGNVVALVTSGQSDDASVALQGRRAIPVNALFGPLDQLRVSSPSKRLVERARRAKDADQKLRLFEAAVRADPSNSSAWFYLAVLYGDKGEKQKQLESMKRFAELRPGSFQAHRNLGLIYMDMKNLDLAVERLRRAAELRPKAARVHNDLGEVYRRKKMYAEAKKELETALSLNPDLAEAHFNLGLLAATVDNNAAVAARHFQRYLDLRPGTPDADKLRQWMDRPGNKPPSNGRPKAQ